MLIAMVQSSREQRSKHFDTCRWTILQSLLDDERGHGVIEDVIQRSASQGTSKTSILHALAHGEDINELQADCLHACKTAHRLYRFYEKLVSIKKSYLDLVYFTTTTGQCSPWVEHVRSQYSFCPSHKKKHIVVSS